MTLRRPLGGKAADPIWRQERARKAGIAAREAHRRRYEARAERYATKGVAYAAGYKTGYQAAMHWWQRKYQRERRAA